MTLVTRADVTPFYGQVEISDPGKRDYPRFMTGHERVVAIPGCIAVVTRGDQEGKVWIEVRRGESDASADGFECVFDGDLVLAGDDAAVGNTIGNELHQVRLGPGRDRVKAFTSPVGGLAHTVRLLVQD